MFKLLSKESNIFSIPVYIGFLLLIVIAFNILSFNTLEAISAGFTFAGFALAYFVFNKINLNYQTHLPLFLYTFFVFALYRGNLDLGLAISLFTNSFLLLILTNQEEGFEKTSYVMVGAILAINYIFLPITWPMIVFVIFHAVGTSERIGLNIFRLIFGFLLVLSSYLGVMYFIHYTTFDKAYFPFEFQKPMTNYYPYYLLIPVVLMIGAAVFNHFQHYNEKSPTSRFKYTFLLIFSLAQLITIILYMGDKYQYLLLLALPCSIILSRYLRFLPKPWMHEAGLWLLIISLIVFKAGTYYQFF